MTQPRKAGWEIPRGDQPNQHVGAMLHGLREQAGLKQYEVARAIGVDPSFISLVERGIKPAPDRVVRFYGERFGAPDLLAGLVELARESERDRTRRRDPVLIAKQASYPLAGDKATFVAEEPPDGVTVRCGASFKRIWTLRNSGTVPWIRRRLRRIGPATGPWMLTSERFIPIPDAEPGQEIAFPVVVRAPQMETAQVAQFKMVDQDDLLYFPDRYSVGLAIYLLVGHEASPAWTRPEKGDAVG